jgi:hypothetical protein
MRFGVHTLGDVELPYQFLVEALGCDSDPVGEIRVFGLGKQREQVRVVESRGIYTTSWDANRSKGQDLHPDLKPTGRNQALG